MQPQRLVVAGEGNEGGGGGGWESPIFTEFWNPLLSGQRRIISAMPLANTLIVSIQKVHVARNCY